MKIEVFQFDSLLSHPQNASLRLLRPEERAISCKTHAFSASTLLGGTQGALIYLSAGGKKDYEHKKVERKIVGSTAIPRLGKFDLGKKGE